MTAGLLDADWHAALAAQAQQAPRRPRVPLHAGGVAVGSVEDGFLNQIAPQRRKYGRLQLSKDEHPPFGWHLLGEPTQALDALAHALREQGLAGAWRNEQLAVADAQGRRVATVERAAVRPLGIATAAVHLAARAPDGRHWVQQRALDKATDPGLWDTLMGGLVSAADTLHDALARETWEEAGLRLEQLRGVARGGTLPVRRPSPDGAGAGYMVEDIAWFHATVPDGVAPCNQDGEVARFALLEPAELEQWLLQGRFTLEAALVLARAEPLFMLSNR
ncbi:NUDIX domain-containing protein [Ramlibacter sp. H39-3-26]|uniref:NUDIX hydrolase n=1 Tax=Curvibacter soli TaxID=3031331 RepID=UPI0023DC6E0D|nr:NUDIX domain-containing protein [Ramlibacter sp. H39-3-26]MDF1483613.1 NUDIX domain-containing protein [Ramlibacter sp. H39-3-26]